MRLPWPTITHAVEEELCAEVKFTKRSELRIPVKLDSDSTPSWTLIPEQAGQSERSDAGFWVFTLLMSLGSSFCRVQ